MVRVRARIMGARVMIELELFLGLGLRLGLGLGLGLVVSSMCSYRSRGVYTFLCVLHVYGSGSG